MKSTAGEVPIVRVVFRRSLPDRGVAARPAWMPSWQRRQITSVLRRRIAMKCIQAGFVFAAGLGEIGELAHVVNLQVLRPLAYLAASSDEPVDQLVSPGTGHDRPLVGEDGRACSPERDPAEAGDQWFPSSFTLDGDLEDRPRPGR